MAYPRLLKLSAPIEDKLTSYLRDEITRHLAERTAFDDEISRLQEDYNAIPTGTKDFPFKDSCNLIIPIFAISFETTHAAVMSTIFGLENQLVEVSASDSMYTDMAYHSGNFFNRYLLKNARFKKDIESSYIELEKFGTGIARARYCKVTKYGVREIGGEEHEFPVVVRDGVNIETVPIGRFMLPYEYQDAQSAKWCGDSHRHTKSQIYQMELDGLFYKGVTDEMYSAVTNNTDGTNKFESEQETLEKRTPIIPVRNTYYEIWMSFNVDSEDEEDEDTNCKEIQVFYSLDNNVLMGVFYNQYSDLRRDYRIGNYVKVENRAFGIGIGKQADMFQREITIQHRQRIDNATLANTRMFKINKQSGYGPGEPLMAGKMWFLDDMKDIEAFQMGEIYPSAYNNEQQSLIYLQQRVGTNELNQGLPQVGTPGTATSDLARLQEAKRKFDYVCENIKSFTLDISLDAIDIIKSNQLVRYATSTEMQYVNQLLQSDMNDIRNGNIVNILLAGSQSNKILDAQKWDSIAPKLQTFYTQMFQLAMQLQDKNMLMAVTQKIISGGNEAMKQVLESADVRNIDTFLLNNLVGMLQQSPVNNPNPQLSPGNNNVQGQPINAGNGNPSGIPEVGTVPNNPQAAS